MILIDNNSKEYLTIVPKELSRYIHNIIDKKLQENITNVIANSISIYNDSGKQKIINDKIDITEFFQYCKDIYINEDLTDINKDFTVDFNNGNILYVDKNYKGILYNGKEDTIKNVGVPYNIISYLEKIEF